MKIIKLLSPNAGVEPLQSMAMPAIRTTAQTNSGKSHDGDRLMVNEEMGGFDARYGRFDGLDPVVEGLGCKCRKRESCCLTGSRGRRIRVAFFRGDGGV